MQAELGIVLECPTHGFHVPRVRAILPHLEARCATCDRYLKFVPKTNAWRALAE